MEFSLSAVIARLKREWKAAPAPGDAEAEARRESLERLVAKLERAGRDGG